MADNYRENMQIQRRLINELRALDTRLAVRLADDAPQYALEIREGVERDRTAVRYDYDRVTADIHAYERTLDGEEFVLHGAMSRPVLRRTDRILLPEDPAAPQIPVWPDPGWDTAAAPAAPAAPAAQIPVVVPADWLVHALPPTPPPTAPATPSAPVRRRSPRRGGKTKRKGKKRKSTKKRKGKSAKKTKKRK